MRVGSVRGGVVWIFVVVLVALCLIEVQPKMPPVEVSSGSQVGGEAGAGQSIELEGQFFTPIWPMFGQSIDSLDLPANSDAATAQKASSTLNQVAAVQALQVTGPAGSARGKEERAESTTLSMSPDSTVRSTGGGNSPSTQDKRRDWDIRQARKQVGSEMRALLSAHQVGLSVKREQANSFARPGLPSSPQSNILPHHINSRWQMGMNLGVGLPGQAYDHSRTGTASQVWLGTTVFSNMRLLMTLTAVQLTPQELYIDPKANLLAADARIEFAPRLVGKNYAFFSLGLGVLRADIDNLSEAPVRKTVQKPSALLEVGIERKIAGPLAIRVSYEYRYIDEMEIAPGRALTSMATVKVGITVQPQPRQRAYDPGDGVIALQVEQEPQKP
ncbi:MAG TPA: hypothetical protein PKW76_03130 [bacterium]|nr:hypothetical protein [bacterium]HPG44652.1 hypothetical protein [bacterium]HPM97210.1 hypothetical protein [bacterium]